MKYIDALRKYNEGKNKWCMPRKGSSDYTIIKKMVDKNYQEKKASIKSSKKHSDVYKSLSKESKNIIDKISKKPKLEKSKNLFMSDKRIQKIQKFFKNYAIKNKYVLENRVKYYKYIQKYIKKIKKSECLKKYIENNDTKYTIGNKLFLIKKIGTKSVNAIIYLTIIKNILGGNLLASKITPITNDNFREINIMDYLTKNVIVKKKSKHFLMMYKYFVCSKNNINSNVSYVSDSKRLIAINELAQGDLKTLFEDRNVIGNNELMYNIFAQTFLSIASFHKLAKKYHNDAHYGNFLYQKNNQVGYYHYVSNNKDYYLKACEYNIMIYDFGYAENITSINAKNILADYLRIINAFMNKYNGWGEYLDLPHKRFNDEMMYIQDQLIYYNQNMNSSNDLNMVDLIYTMIQKGPKNMHNNIFTNIKPSKILNKIPFVV